MSVGPELLPRISRPTQVRGIRLIVITVISALMMIPTGAALADTMTSDARKLRIQASQTMNTYLSLYGDRLTPIERATLEDLSQKADAELAKVEFAIVRAERVPLGNKAKKVSALQSAMRSHAAAKVQAEKSLDTAQAILQRRLSIFEAFDALSDYERLMATYDRLGTALQEQATALR